MNIGDRISSLPYQATNQQQGDLSDFRGRWLVLYFYPKDSTPGCTLEGQDFRDNHEVFVAANAVVFGISRDSLKSHEAFKMKQGFPFELISDSNELICEAFGVIKMKSMYGKQVRGIERSTFLISPDGTVKFVWRGVKVKGHVAEIISVLTNNLEKN